MGIIKAAAGAIGGALADQWLETIEPADMDNSILATYGTLVRKTTDEARIAEEQKMSFPTAPSSMYPKMYTCFWWTEAKSFRQRMNPDTGR